jgi:signal transduction histidine kinase
LKRSLGSWTRGASLRPGLVRLDITPDCRWPLAVEFAAHQIACEAVQNAIRHSGGSRVLVRAVGTDAGLGLCVDDDGSGFVVGQAEPPSGLWQMRWRAESVGGQLTIGPPPSGPGTRVRTVLPS